MSLVTLINKKRHEVLEKNINLLPVKKIYHVLGNQFQTYDFKTDTQQIVKLLGKVKVLDKNALNYLKLVMFTLPDLHERVQINSDNLVIDNQIFMSLLENYKTDRDLIIHQYNMSSEKYHAQNTYAILSSFSDIDIINYEEQQLYSDQSRNVLVKAVLSHQQHCLVCGCKLDIHNTTIDHLVALNDRRNKIIPKNSVNKIFNLTKMCSSCNYEKTNDSLLEYHFNKGGFKFYPVNVSYLLHLQREILINQFNWNGVFREAFVQLQDYSKKYKNKFSKKGKLKKAIEKLPVALFSQGISKETLIEFI